MWFPPLSDLQNKIMQAHRIYNNKRPSFLASSAIPLVKPIEVLPEAPSPLIDGRFVYPQTIAMVHLNSVRLFPMQWTLLTPKGWKCFVFYLAVLKINGGGGRRETFESATKVEHFLNLLMTVGEKALTTVPDERTIPEEIECGQDK